MKNCGVCNYITIGWPEISVGTRGDDALDFSGISPTSYPFRVPSLTLTRLIPLPFASFRLFVSSLRRPFAVGYTSRRAVGNGLTVGEQQLLPRKRFPSKLHLKNMIRLHSRGRASDYHAVSSSRSFPLSSLPRRLSLPRDFVSSLADSLPSLVSLTSKTIRSSGSLSSSRGLCTCF